MGDWQGALAALKKANQLPHGGTSCEWFFLAMAHGQLGDAKQARQCYDRGVQYLEKNQIKIKKSSPTLDIQLRGFKSEAEKLLAIQPPAPAQKTKSRAELAAEAEVLDRQIKAKADAVLYVRRGRVHATLGQHDKALSDYTEALQAKPDYAPARLERARLYLALEQWDNACADFAQEFKRDPDNLESTYGYAGALLLAGDMKGYQQLCARLIERGDNLKAVNQPGRKSFLVARICLLAPDAVADPARPGQLAEQAVKAQRAVYTYHTLALAHYRAGRQAEAFAQIQKSMQVEPMWSAQPVNGLVLAMIHHRLGDADEAQEWLDKAIQGVERLRRDTSRGPIGNPGMHSHDWMSWLLLRREAEVLLHTDPESRNSDSNDS
jgi:eukaryotic-like serine/threonine-protein kinase